VISAHQQLLCALETVRTDVLMRGLPDCGLALTARSRFH
jgi:hypothetical protein